MNDRANRPFAEGWDTYWRGAGSGAAYSSGGISHPVITIFWDEVFVTVKECYANPRILDVATGNGAVVECICRTFGSNMPQLTCLDISAGAVRAVTKRWPAARGVIADARAIPLASASVDIVTSQFGVEYAGSAAIREMLRLPTRGGRIVLLMHHRSGGIYKECAASLDAVRRIRDAGFFPHCIRMFEAGFAACRGGDRHAYEIAAKRLLPAFRSLEAIMTEHGRHVAGDTVLRLYHDVDRIHQRMPHYDPAEVLNWLRRMEDELQMYAARMTSMCDSAIDERSFGRLCHDVRGLGYQIDRANALQIPDHELPIAWSLIATGA